MCSCSSDEEGRPEVEEYRRPRRTTTSKLFYKKRVWPGEGLIRKAVVRGDEVIRWKKDMDKEFPGGGHKKDGLIPGVSYALKKKNRHLFPESIENGQFNFDATNSSLLETVSMNRIYSNYRGKVNHYPFESLSRHCIFARVTVISRDGEVTTTKGVVKAPAPDYASGVDREKYGKDSLHYQYDFNEYEYIPNIHRPSYKCGCWSCTHPRSEEMREEYVLGKNVARTGHLAVEDRWEEDDEENDEEDDEAEEETAVHDGPSATFNLGDVPVQKSKRKTKPRVEDDWVQL